MMDPFGGMPNLKGTTALLKKLVSHFEETARAWRLSDVLAGVEYQNFTTSYGVARESTMPIYTMEEVVPTGCVLGTATPSGTTFVVHARGRACAMHCSPVQYEHIRRHCRGGESMESKYPHLYLDVPGDIHPKLWEDAVNVHKEAIALWQTPTHSNLSSCVGCVFTPVPSSCAGDELANETICIGYLYEHCTAGSLESLLGLVHGMKLSSEETGQWATLCAALFSQVARGVQWVHEHACVLFELSPATILLQYNPDDACLTAKVCVTGACTVCPPRQQALYLTRAKGVMGYQCPRTFTTWTNDPDCPYPGAEQLTRAGKAYLLGDSSADIYSFGVCLAQASARSLRPAMDPQLEAAYDRGQQQQQGGIEQASFLHLLKQDLSRQTRRVNEVMAGLPYARHHHMLQCVVAAACTASRSDRAAACHIADMLAAATACSECSDMLRVAQNDVLNDKQFIARYNVLRWLAVTKLQDIQVKCEAAAAATPQPQPHPTAVIDTAAGVIPAAALSVAADPDAAAAAVAPLVFDPALTGGGGGGGNLAADAYALVTATPRGWRWQGRAGRWEAQDKPAAAAAAHASKPSTAASEAMLPAAAAAVASAPAPPPLAAKAPPQAPTAAATAAARRASLPACSGSSAHGSELPADLASLQGWMPPAGGAALMGGLVAQGAEAEEAEAPRRRSSACETGRINSGGSYAYPVPAAPCPAQAWAADHTRLAAVPSQQSTPASVGAGCAVAQLRSGSGSAALHPAAAMAQQPAMHAATTAAADGDSDVNADDSNVFGLLFDAWYGEDKGDGFGLLGEDHFEGILEQQAQQQQQDERCSKRAARGCDNALDDEYNFDAGLDVHSSEYQRNKQQRLQ